VQLDRRAVDELLGALAERVREVELLQLAGAQIPDGTAEADLALVQPIARELEVMARGRCR